MQIQPTTVTEFHIIIASIFDPYTHYFHERSVQLEPTDSGGGLIFKSMSITELTDKISKQEV